MLSTRLAVVSIAWRTYGWRGLLRRSRHELRRRLTRFKAAPEHSLGPGEGARGVHYKVGSVWSSLSDDARDQIIRRAERVAAGEYQAFSDRWHALPLTADQWHRHPQTDYDFGRVSWWQIALLPPGHDVKDVWEPARFAWVYDLVRGFAVTGNAAFAEAFYQHALQWCDANPPFKGPHWACGQETSLRVLALLHGLDNLPCSDATTLERLDDVLGWSGERVADAIGYGLSQRNNHGISEAAGLVHLGLRLRGRHPDASGWLRDGLRWLDEQIGDQFSRDGWYAQHSFTYMRVALEQAVMAQRALRAANQSLSERSLALMSSAVHLLLQVMDGDSGVAPNHGANDGALTAPLSVAAYRDFRPIATLACVVLADKMPLDISADPVTLCWLGASAPEAAAARPDGVQRGESGWVVARVARTSVFMWAGEYRHRPSHLDALHIHVWLDGVEVITDPGTFAYNAQAPWSNALGSALVHNAPVINAQETAVRGPRFLWLEWPKAVVLDARFDGGKPSFAAERPGAVRRDVTVSADQVTVRDAMQLADNSAMQVRWLLHPDASATHAITTAPVANTAPDDQGVTGWFSPTYARRVQSRTIYVHSASGGVIETTIAARDDTGVMHE